MNSGIWIESEQEIPRRDRMKYSITNNFKVLRLYQVNWPLFLPESSWRTWEELYIGKNQLTHLPPEIGKLKKLKILSVQYNRLKDLPEETEGAGKASNNWFWIRIQLKSLPPTIGRLSNYQNYNWIIMNWQVFLRNYAIVHNYSLYNWTEMIYRKYLPAISRLKQLRELSLVQTGRLCNWLPEELCGLGSLELLSEVDQMVVVPSCALVNRTNRLQIGLHYWTTGSLFLNLCKVFQEIRAYFAEKIIWSEFRKEDEAEYWRYGYASNSGARFYCCFILESKGRRYAENIPSFKARLIFMKIHPERVKGLSRWLKVISLLFS